MWLYFRFPLSYRDVAEILAARGSVVSYETGRQWCLKFGQLYANQLRRCRPQPGDKWHIDAVFRKINGQILYLWRAVEQQGNILDMLVTAKRDKQAAKRFFRKLLRGCRYVPCGIITDKGASSGAAKRKILWGVEHRPHKGLNNRAENAHQATRQQERQKCRFKSAGHGQRFLAAFEPIGGHFRLSRHHQSAREYPAQREQRCQSWHEVPGVATAA